MRLERDALDIEVDGMEDKENNPVITDALKFVIFDEVQCIKTSKESKTPYHLCIIFRIVSSSIHQAEVMRDERINAASL